MANEKTQKDNAQYASPKKKRKNASSPAGPLEKMTTKEKKKTGNLIPSPPPRRGDFPQRKAKKEKGIAHVCGKEEEKNPNTRRPP